MADDDLDMLQQLLEMAEDDDRAVTDSPDAKRRPSSELGHTSHRENAPPNKRPRLAPIEPLAQGKHMQPC